MEMRKLTGKKTLLLIALLSVAAITAGCSRSFDDALAYEQETENDGIAYDLDGNRYFDSELKGYGYGTVESITYHSDVTGGDRHARVWLPEGYDGNERFPVLYLLHGMDGDENSWLRKDADIILENLHYLNGAPEMVVVFPNCNVNAGEDIAKCSWPEIVDTFDLVGQDITDNLMPYVNEHYKVLTDKNNTAIAGNSLGGREALMTAFTHQEIFGYIGAFSTITPLADASSEYSEAKLAMKEFSIDENSDGFRLIMMNVGDKDPYIENSYNVDRSLSDAGIDHIFYVMDGRHNDRVWRNSIYNFGRLIFSDK